MPVIAVAVVEGWAMQVIREWGAEEGIDVDIPQQAYATYGKMVWWGDVQTSRICQVFQRVVNAYQGGDLKDIL